MRVRKSCIIIVCFSVLLFSAIGVVADTEEDDKDDVWHFVYPYWQTQTVGNQANVDIKEISAEISEDQITLSMTLWPDGAFERSDYEAAVYLMFYNTSDAYYWMSYVDTVGQEEPVGFAWGILLEGGGLQALGEVVVTDNVISSTLNITGEDTTALEFYGTAQLWEKYGTGDQYTADAWVDWIGDFSMDLDFDPGSNNNNDGTIKEKDDGTPGFEAIALLTAVAVALILIKRRR